MKMKYTMLVLVLMTLVMLSSVTSKTVQTQFDASTLHSNTALAAETQMVDDGRGKTEIWRVEDFDLVPIQQKCIGQFFGGDCYVILYTYLVNGKENYIIYYWQGAKSSADEKGTSALKAVELDDKLGGVPVQVKVVQGKEPQHFMSMFDGKMIIFSDDGPGDSYILQVRGTSVLNTKATQVTMTASSLNSNDVFVIFTKAAVYIWCGKGSIGDETEVAKLVAKRSPREHQIVIEGQEKDSFWAAIGGKDDYADNKLLQDPETAHAARLFQLSNASGRFTSEEIPEFSQDDLVSDDCMILDAWDTVYIWVGAGVRSEEMREAERLALEYVKDPADRDPDIPVYKVKQGYESPTFKGFFGVWDADYFKIHVLKVFVEKNIPSLVGLSYQLSVLLPELAVEIAMIQQGISRVQAEFTMWMKH